MQLDIHKDFSTLSFHAAERILDTVKQNPTAVLCLATGNTPRLTYEMLAAAAIRDQVDFTRCFFVALDEWVGIPPGVEGSCAHSLQHQVFGPLQIAGAQVHLFDALATDPAAECAKMDQVIEQKGGISLMLVGVGMNGHVGFNEPGAPLHLRSHVIRLDETTRMVGQKYFRQTFSLSQGITLGLQQVMESEQLIMIANGTNKAEIMQRSLEGPISEAIPATMVRNHPQAIVMLDEEAASLLTRTGTTTEQATG